MNESEIAALKLHHLPHDKPSQLADSFLAGLRYAQQKAEPVISQKRISELWEKAMKDIAAGFFEQSFIPGEREKSGATIPQYFAHLIIGEIDSCRPKQEPVKKLAILPSLWKITSASGKTVSYVEEKPGQDHLESGGTVTEYAVLTLYDDVQSLNRVLQEPAACDCPHPAACKVYEQCLKQETADKCEKCDCFMVEHSADGTCPETNSATPYPDNIEQSDEAAFEAMFGAEPPAHLISTQGGFYENPNNIKWRKQREGFLAGRQSSRQDRRDAEQSDEAAFVAMFGPRPLINGRNIKGWTLAGWNQMHDGFLAGRQSSRRDREDAERWRYWKEKREVSIVTALFGNGCINKTIADAEAKIDAARKEQGE